MDSKEIEMIPRIIQYRLEPNHAGRRRLLIAPYVHKRTDGPRWERNSDQVWPLRCIHLFEYACFALRQKRPSRDTGSKGCVLEDSFHTA